ncbi:hypothetical protein K2X33_02255 [bacterium]|nr:hypothetical protein [bacterium]
MKHIASVFLTLAVAAQAVAAAPSRGTAAAPPAGKSVFVGAAIDGLHSGNSTVPAFTAMFLLSDKTSLQTYLSMPSVTPTFKIGGGANLKYAIVGDVLRGLHFGAGVGLGTNGNFFINVAPILGIHFELVDRVIVSLESGVGLFIQPSGTPTVDVQVGGFSPNFGASIVLGL